MTSVVDVCNSALNMIGASNITALTEDSKAGRLCAQRFGFIRDTISRSHPWNCLTIRTSLAADSAAPEFEFTKQFTLPTDPFCLRVLGLSNPDTLFRIEGRKLICNEDTIQMSYIGRITDINEYDALLIETIAAYLAADIAYPLVASSALRDRATAEAAQKMREARFVDASEDNQINTSVLGDSRTLAADTFITSRF
tara:strand:+ start:1216 stop:1806 length:591 start_codon:yes stop_codon:yes gene_type:complete